jgi:hypothetical protein
MLERPNIVMDVEVAKSKQKSGKEIDLGTVDNLKITPLEKQDNDPKLILQYLKQMAFILRGFTKNLPVVQLVDYKDLLEHARKFLPQVSDFVHLFQDLVIDAPQSGL